MAAPVVEINAVDVTDEVAYNQLHFGLNKLDLTLVDPAAIPALGESVTVDTTTWVGTVTSTTLTDNDIGGHQWVKVTATNADEVVVTPAPFGLTDATNDYRRLTVTRTLHEAEEEIRGSLETFISGLLPGHVFTLTSATHGFTAQEFSITDVQVSWLTDDTPLYSIEFGDAIVTLSAWATEDSGILPITETKITDGAVSTPKISANGLEAAVIKGGTLTLGGVDGTVLTVLNADGEEIGTWGDTGLMITDPLNSLLKVRLVDGELAFSEDGGLTWTTAINGQGITADAIRLGSFPGGHNLIPNSGMEMVDWNAVNSKLWTSAADWQSHLASTDLNIDDSGTSLTMNDELY